jgi:hypothetical protein
MKVNIRKAQLSDLDDISKVAYQTYFKRFFCTESTDRLGNLYGAPLATDHPELAQGQNYEWFYDQWKTLLQKATSLDFVNRPVIYVAEVDNNIKGFIKGVPGPLDKQTYKQFRDKNLFGSLDRQYISELGSIYISFDHQDANTGRLLVQKYSQTMEKLGFKAMVTRCYIKNDSPHFFRKLGAQESILCDIPNGYFKYDGQSKTVQNTDIKGICLAWDNEQFSILNQIDVLKVRKGQKVSLKTYKDQLDQHDVNKIDINFGLK